MKWSLKSLFPGLLLMVYLVNHKRQLHNRTNVLAISNQQSLSPLRKHAHVIAINLFKAKNVSFIGFSALTKQRDEIFYYCIVISNILWDSKESFKAAFSNWAVIWEETFQQLISSLLVAKKKVLKSVFVVQKLPSFYTSIWHFPLFFLNLQCWQFATLSIF